MNHKKKKNYEKIIKEQKKEVERFRKLFEETIELAHKSHTAGFREGQNHIEPSKKTLEIIFKMIEITNNFYTEEFQKKIKIVRFLKYIFIELIILIFLVFCILGSI